MQDFARAARIAFEPFVQVVQEWERFGAAVQKTLEPIQRIREAFSAIPPEQLSAFQQAIAAYPEDLRFGWDIVEAPVFRLFAELGLTGLESHLTRSELLHVLKLSKAKGKKSVQDYLFRKFRRDKFRMLNRVIRSWWSHPYMEKRKRTVRAAINAHKNRQYATYRPCESGSATTFPTKDRYTIEKYSAVRLMPMIHHASPTVSPYAPVFVPSTVSECAGSRAGNTIG